MTNAIGCVIWTRVSTKHQEDNGGSLDYQKDVCETYAKKHGYPVLGYFGGTHESAKTPGVLVKTMLNAVKKDKQIKYILVSEFDRFSRNTAQALTILNELSALGVIVVAAKTGQDTSTRDGMLLASVGLSLAQWDNANRVDKFLSGRRDCFQKGIWIDKAPMGYTKTGKSKNSVCHLNDTGLLIRQAFLWKLDYMPNSEILAKLKARGLDISKQQLHKILVNPFYAGKIRHKMTDNQLIDGVQEQAISYGQFLKVQEILSGRTGKYTQNKKNEDSPLRKHVLCVKDNCPLTYYIVKKPSGKQYGYYKCNERGCNTNVSANTLHTKYEQLLEKYNLPEPMKEGLVIAFSKIQGDGNKDLNAQLTQMRKRDTEIRKRISQCKLRFATGEIDEDVYHTALASLEKDLALNEEEMNETNRKISNSSYAMEMLVETCCKSADLWERGGLDIKRRVQNLVFPEGVFWNNENREYLTNVENKMFSIIRRISALYDTEKGLPLPEAVPLCGRRDSNPYALGTRS